ncbi:serine-type endopeptidase [Mycena filopes]|nr:serine-type endopeptidase [Mycena filopes]
MASLKFTFALLCLAASVSSTPFTTTPPRALAPFAQHQRYGLLNNSYIVVLKPDVHPHVMENHFNFLRLAHETQPLVEDGGFAIKHVYPRINGYAGRFSADAVAQLRAMPEVDYVEQDQIVRTQELTTQRAAPWGLARVSHRPALTFGTFTRYEYDDQGGAGVDVYVIDTGIHTAHNEFEGRASWGTSIPDDILEDGNGHGTHCAGTIASRKYGVAKAANVIAVKVLGADGSGSMSDVIYGVLWAAEAAAEKAVAGKTAHKGSVANMSLGGGKSTALDRAVNSAVDSGLHFAVAAGNDNRDACSYSPAAAEKAITVGASTLGDERAYFSNHGKCVDVFAPGLNIQSTWTGSPTATKTISGTSMASPHVAGVIAYFLSLHPHKTFDPQMGAFFDVPVVGQRPLVVALQSAVYAALPAWAARLVPEPKEMAMAMAPVPGKITPAQMKSAVVSLATRNILTDLPGNTANLLIFNNATSA